VYILDTLGWIAGIVTRGQKKFTWLGWWESLSTPGGQLAGCLADLKTSPSRCAAWYKKENLCV
jgi:hypothetical protein